MVNLTTIDLIWDDPGNLLDDPETPNCKSGYMSGVFKSGCSIEPLPLLLPDWLAPRWLLLIERERGWNDFWSSDLLELCFWLS